MANSELKPDVHQASTGPSPAQWPWYLAVILVVGAVEPLVGSVRHESEPVVGHWLAYALGILAAGAAALPMLAVVTWVVRREQSNQSDGLAKMTYRPAALPGVVFLGAILRDFPGALTEIATYGFLGGFVLLLAITVVIQKRRAHAWSWPFAIAVGFGIALLALIAAGVLSLAGGHRP